MSQEEKKRLKAKLGGNPKAQATAWKGANSRQRALITEITGYTGPADAPVSPGKQLLRRARRAQTQS